MSEPFDPGHLTSEDIVVLARLVKVFSDYNRTGFDNIGWLAARSKDDLEKLDLILRKPKEVVIEVIASAEQNIWTKVFWRKAGYVSTLIAGFTAFVGGMAIAIRTWWPHP